MDHRIAAVLDRCHDRMKEERAMPHDAATRGRDGGQDQRMRAVGPQTGQFLNLLVRNLQMPTVLELGTSFGYSGIWLAEAARAASGHVITMEVHGYKSDYARQMAEEAGLADTINFRVGDAVAMIAALPRGVDFVLVDLWKDLYLPCLRAFGPKLNPGAIVVADNINPGRDDVRELRGRDPRHA